MQDEKSKPYQTMLSMFLWTTVASSPLTFTNNTLVIDE